MNFKIWKRRLAAAFACIDLKILGLSAVLSLFLGIIIGVSGGGRYPFVYCLPNGALPTFLVMFFWGLTFALLGAAFGNFLFSRRCGPRREQALLLFVFALTLSYVWIPLIYKAGCLFLGLMVSLLLVFALVLLFFALHREAILSAIAVALCEIWAVYAAYYTLLLLLLNG